MKRKMKLPELLAPAGDFDCLVAAVRGGADAVYVGGKSFGARAFAKNFEPDELARAVVYCHLHGVRLYVTVNTMLTDREIGEAVAFAAELYRIGVDALIVSDLGLVRLLRRAIPGMELHASTQMSIHNTDGADVAYGLGCTRVVLARETSGADIAKITEGCKPETEVFLHGALCVCHSGQCLFSAMVGGRSGNRGECAQPCRLPFGSSYPLSLTDLSLAGHIPSLISSGVASLKIEGRMKSPDYVYTVTSIYRRLLDENRAATREEENRLHRAFSRGGFTDGYYTGKIESRSMLGVRSEEDKRASREDRDALGKEVQVPTRVRISAFLRIMAGAPATLTLTLPGIGGCAPRTATAIGEIPSPAISRPLLESDVRARVAKMGNTFFTLDPEDITLELDGGVNLSPAAINALRRDAVSALERADLGDRPEFVLGECDLSAPRLENTLDGITTTALFLDPEVYNSLTDAESVIDLAFIPLWRMDEVRREGFGIAIPPVVMESECDEVRAMLASAAQRGVKYALVSNIGGIKMCREAGLVPIGDFRFNIANLNTGAVLAELGVKKCLLSAELTPATSRSLGGSVISYGRIPLMITERCFMRDSFGCSSCSACALTDRRGARFPMMREYRHRTLILNSAITYMADKRGELRGGLGEHLIFSTESVREVREVLSAFARGERMPLSYPFRRMGRREVKPD